MITIERVVLKNFMKYKSLDFKFEKGITSIVGANRSGKSTIIEAVYWCLTGERARGGRGVFKRDAKPDDPCAVIVYAKKDKTPFGVVRIATPKGTQKLAFDVNGNQSDYTTGNLPLDQAKLEQFLGLSPQFLLSSILVGHNSFRFSRAKDSERKEVFENILNLDVYTAARKIAGDKLKELQGELNGAMSTWSTLRHVIVDMEERQAAASKASDSGPEIKKLEAEVKKAEDKMRVLVGKLGESTKSFNVKINTYRDVMQPKAKRLLSVIAECNSQINEMRKSKSCVLCGQPVTAEMKKDMIDTKTMEQNSAEFELKKLDKEAREISDRIPTYEKIQDLSEEVGNWKIEIDELKEKSVDTSLQSTIAKNKREANAVKKKITKLESDIVIYEFWNKGFSRQGVISLLLDAAINELNGHLIDIGAEMTENAIVAQYSSTTELKKGGASDKLSLICIIDGEPFEYEDLSNSEQQRVDMMTIFAIRRLIRENFESVNLVCYDEAFESFDDDTTEIVFNYLKTEHKKDSVYTISHLLDTQFKADRVKRTVKTATGSSVI